MNVSSRRFANAIVLLVEGRLDQDTCGDFTRELMTYVDSVAHGGGAIILDLSHLEYVSSAGLRCFMLASRQAKAQSDIARVFRTSGIDAIQLRTDQPYTFTLAKFFETRERRRLRG